MGTDYDKLTVVKLKEELKKRNLSLTGLKADLIQRLEEADNQQPGTAAEAAAGSTGTPAKEHSAPTNNKSTASKASARSARKPAEKEAEQDDAPTSAPRTSGRAAATRGRQAEEDGQATGAVAAAAETEAAPEAAEAEAAPAKSAPARQSKTAGDKSGEGSAPAGSPARAAGAASKASAKPAGGRAAAAEQEPEEQVGAWAATAHIPVAPLPAVKGADAPKATAETRGPPSPVRTSARRKAAPDDEVPPEAQPATAEQAAAAVNSAQTLTLGAPDGGVKPRSPSPSKERPAERAAASQQEHRGGRGSQATKQARPAEAPKPGGAEAARSSSPTKRQQDAQRGGQSPARPASPAKQATPWSPAKAAQSPRAPANQPAEPASGLVSEAAEEPLDFEDEPLAPEDAAPSPVAKSAQAAGAEGSKRGGSREDRSGEAGREADRSRKEAGTRSDRKRRHSPIPVFIPRGRREAGDAAPASADGGGAGEGVPSGGAAKVQRVTSGNGRLPVDQAQEEGQEQERPEPPGGGKPPSRALRVDGFIRPFTEVAARALLGRHGTVEGFWMPTIKKFAYVVYEAEEQAVAARRALYRLQWPVGNPGSVLFPEFVGVEEAQEAMARATGGAPLRSNNSGAGGALNAVAQAAAASAAAENGRPARQDAPAARQGADGAHARAPAAAGAPQADPQPAQPEPMQEDEEGEALGLDDLFRKTTCKPYLYWLPLTPEQAAARKAAAAAAPKGDAPRQPA